MYIYISYHIQSVNLTNFPQWRPSHPGARRRSCTHHRRPAAPESPGRMAGGDCDVGFREIVHKLKYARQDLELEFV